MSFLKILSFLFAILLSISVFAKTVFLTDLEGRIEPLQQLIKDGVFKVDSVGNLDFVDSDTKLVFGGDLMDRGANTIKLMRYFINLKRKYPERVNILLGNRDLNKLSFSVVKEEKLENLQDAKYREFLQKKLASTENSNLTIQKLNTVENQIQFWASEFGLTKVIELHQEELRELKKSEVTYAEAAKDFADLITNPEREYLQFVKLGQLVHSEGSVVYVHGGLPSQNGFVPDSAIVHGNFENWQNSLNQWMKSELNDFVNGLKQGSVGNKGKKLIFYSDAQFDSQLNKVWNHDNSVIYGPRFKENDNFRLPQEGNLAWLKANGKNMMILGHSPAGNVPTPLRGSDVLVVMADTSYAPNGTAAQITVDKDIISIRGSLENGTEVNYKTSPHDSQSLIGLKFGSEMIVGKTLDGSYATFKYVGYNREERVVAENEISKQNVEIPTYQLNSVIESEKKVLLDALAQRGQRILDIVEFENDFLNKRTPILFSGSSAYADPTQEAIARQMIEATLKNLDPSKVVIITGATDKGPEKMVHEIASKMGFYIHGLVVSAAVPEEVSKYADSISWVGHDWAAQPKAGMDFIKNANGFGIILGGGGLLQKGLEYGLSIKANFYVASNIKHGNGAISASMNFSSIIKDRSFSNARSLVKILKNQQHSSVVKTIQEATPEEALNAIKGRGKNVVTFIGFSGAEYENKNEIIQILKSELQKLDPKSTIINIGGTSDGIGVLYQIAKEMSFETTGIVSSKASASSISPYCDRTYLIKDNSWGGFLRNTKILSPTSKAMVEASHSVIAIGGGDIGRDEFLMAKAKGLPTKFYPAQMNKQIAEKKSAKAGKPAPTEFRGSLELQLIQHMKNGGTKSCQSLFM